MFFSFCDVCMPTFEDEVKVLVKRSVHGAISPRVVEGGVVGPASELPERLVDGHLGRRKNTQRETERERERKREKERERERKRKKEGERKEKRERKREREREGERKG